ncbi:hypothetical protein EOD39_17431 [Acipenser ruthenus]|uniref:Uncharacterized protein n=1 Tax=Acipenser ruthenus TaxID=7906 RepID=A0A444V3F1_ACIRT|nr:hypothetical protein EOD39_17431 [Acipenser ruthenus]
MYMFTTSAPIIGIAVIIITMTISFAALLNEAGPGLNPFVLLLPRLILLGNMVLCIRYQWTLCDICGKF